MYEETDGITWGLQIGPPASQLTLEVVQTQLGVVFPRDYADFMIRHSGAEGWLGRSYLMLYPLDQLISLNELGRIGEFLPGFVLFGSDGGGTEYLFDARISTVTIVAAADIGATPDTVKYCADGFAGFLEFLRST